MAIRDEKVNLLKSVDIFSETPEQVLTKISLALVKVIVSPEQTIIHKGAMGDCMYIIFRGSVKVHEGIHTITEMKAGKIFGELSLIDPEPRSASVTAIEETILYRLDQAVFYEIIARRPEVAQGIMRLLVSRLRLQNNTIIASLKKREKELTDLVNIRTAELSNAYETLKLKQVEVESAYEELRAINDELQATNDHLIDANREILKQKNEIEKQRDQILRQQEQVIQSANLAAVGLIAPTVAHEINTPLGAIRGALYNLRGLLPEIFQQIPEILVELSQDKHPFFWHSLNKLADTQGINLTERTEAHLLRDKLQASGVFEQEVAEQISTLWLFLQRNGVNISQLSAREERKTIQLLTNELEIKGISHAEELSEKLVMAGLHENIDEIIPLLEETRALNTLLKIGRLWKQMLTIQNATDKAIRIVVALKEYVAQKVEAVNIVENIEVVLTLYDYYLSQGIEVIKEFEISGIYVLASPHELAQVWTNLIMNSVKAMKGKGNIRLKVYLPEPNFVVVSVEDYGSGIPADEIATLFTHKFQDASPRNELSGVGLPVCRAVIDKYHGQISVKSDVGYTCFSVRLPICQI